MRRKWAVTIVLFITTALIAGCGLKASKEQALHASVEEESPIPLELPATFTGTIGCEGCQKVDISLNLRPDHLYQLRKTYHLDNGEQRVEAQMRNWRFDRQENLVILGKQKGALKTYRIVDQQTLRFQDIEGEGKDELISYDLGRLDSPDPFHDVVKMRGMYSSTGNTHTFSECSSGNSFPVDPSGKFYELDRTYRNTPHEKNSPQLVSIKGKLITTGIRNQRRDIIIVEGFKRIYPDQNCEGAVFEKSMFGVTWEAVEIDGNPVVKDKKGKAPVIVLEAAGKRVKGTTGCNSFFGTYLFKGDVFIFNKIASTRMACPDILLTEDAFFQAMDKTESYVMENDLLIFLDKHDDPVIKLKATY